ncbi:hypothetical protein ACFYY9_26550 [Streptomyces nigra]|uniref:hypothetical protein n=1 Tax=Streptomyces nigra TaxID=1827580 RepID=UPI00367E0B68
MAAISVGSVEVDVVPNTRGIRAQLQRSLVPAADQVGDEIGRIIGRHVSTQLAQAVRNGVTTGARTAQPAAVRGGQQTGSTFARSLRGALQAGLARLPEVQLRADSSDAQRELAAIQAQMRALSDVRIGIDVDSATATAAMAQLQARLDRLSASDADVQIRVDAAAASAQLAAFNAQVNRLDGRTANVDVDTRSAGANLNLLTTAALAFGPAIIPALPVVAAGLGAIAAAGAAAAVGIGAIGLVAIPAFKGISSALQAQKAAQDAATNASYQGGQANSQGASKALQMASAQQSLATAERNGARQIAQAQAQVKQAKQAAADAVAQAAQRNAEAARRVQDAERSLADAQRDARRAQEDLSDARKQAALELEDLNTRLDNSVLSQRDAEIALKEATIERDKVLQNANATELDKQKAILAYDQAVQRLKDQTTETARLKTETAAANKAGVEGSNTVRAAQERVAESQRAVADRARAVKDAQQEAARTQVETARQVADAQQRVGEATANVAVAQQNAADAVASAQRQIESASLSAAGGVDQAAIAQAKYEAELAKLTPAARETMTAYLGLRDAFSQWSKSLQPAVMPIFTRALNAMKRALPGLTPFVLEASDAIQGLGDRASKELKTPFWKGFKDDLEKSVKPAIEGLGVGFGNVFKGMAGVIDAFLPHMDGISRRMQDVTAGFANWGTGLKGSPEFEKFLAYSSEMAPKLWDTLKKIAVAALDIGKAMSPISTIVLEMLGYLAEGISWVATKAPWAIQLIYGIVAAMTAWRIATSLWSIATKGAAIAMRLFNLVSMAGPWGWIVLAIMAVVGIIVLLWNKCDWFRNAVKAVWEAIKTAASVVVDWFKGPFARFWTETLPGFFKAGWDLIKTWVLNPWKTFFTETVPGWARFLRDKVVGAWNATKDGLKAGWDGIKNRVLYPVRDFFTKTVPGWGTTLKDKVVAAFDLARKGIKEAWDRIKKIARDPIQYVVDIVYNKGIRGVWNKIAGAFGADKLAEFKFARGGVMPGYTPGRDVHRFISPTGGALELSGGEAIMRPEFTRAVGSGFVHSLNAIARSRGAQGVKAALAPTFAGNPATSTDRSLRYASGGVFPHQKFADGGIFSWIGKAASAVAGAGSAAWNKVKQGASWLKDTLEASARAGVKNVVDPLLKSFPGMDTGIGKMIRRIPTKIIDALFGYSKKADDKGAGGIGGPKIQAALKWAKTQNGKPYQWGGNGNPSWDCSGFMSAIESVIRGQKPHRRWSTHAFSGKTAPPGWVYHGNSAFKVGITNAGVGHTAGTLGKTKVESRGGDGVIVGSRARGFNDKLFTSWYGFKPGTYDSGGYLQPGLNLAYNGTGRPEPVFTTSQANALGTLASRGTAGPASFEGNLYLDSGEFLGKVRGEAAAVVQEGQRQLIGVLNAG